MADPIYTLQSNGLAVRNDTGTISTQWWSQSPTETPTIGSFYQARATKIKEGITPSVTLTGIFGQWISLSSDQSWAVDSEGTNFGGVRFLLEIRDIFTNTVQASATIQLGAFDDSVLGDFNWLMDDVSGDVEELNNANMKFEPLVFPPAADIAYQQTSLKKNNTGNSIRLFSSNQFNVAGTLDNEVEVLNNNFDLSWNNGFTIEFITKIDAQDIDFINNRGKTGSGITSQGNFTGSRLFVLQFDNWNATFNDPLFPTLSIIKRDSGTQLDSINRYPNAIFRDIRGTTALVLGNTYHFLATFRPSDNTAEFWLNGVSQGSDSLGLTWFTDNGSLLDGTRATRIKIGSDQLQGTGADHTTDEMKIHFLEADTAFAVQQASTANFTT